MSKFKIVLLSIAFCIFSVAPLNTTQKIGAQVQYKWFDSGSLEQERAVCIRAFSKAYENISLEVLNIKNLNEFINGVFDAEQTELNSKTKPIYFISAYNGGTVVGFVSFSPTENHREVYIRLLAVDPYYWSQGIGKKLIFSILSCLPRTKKLIVATRKINKIGCNFYRAIGFKESTHIPEGLDPKRYVGFEYTVVSLS